MQPHAAKAEAIAELLLNQARAAVINMRALASASRKNPRILSKNINYRSRLLRRRRIGLLTASLAIGQALASANLAIIMATPTPKFPLGGRSAIIDEYGKESLQPHSEIEFIKKGNDTLTRPFSPDANASLPF